MNRRLIIRYIISIFPLFTYQYSFAQPDAGKKIIEFGWDCPNISSLKDGIDKMERISPFDGTVFTFDFHIYNAFDTSDRPESVFQYQDLSQIRWKKFTDNFLLVRGAGFSDAHWLDDKSWTKIVRNLRRVSKALLISHAKGIGFDPEYYYNNPDFNPWIYRASLYHNLTYEEVGQYVRKRGAQFIQAMQTYKPDIKVLCFWLLGLVSMQEKNLPIEETAMALFPFFVEGMLEGQNGKSQIIDGNEYSYGFETPDHYIESGNYQRAASSELLGPSFQSRLNKVTLANAVFFDLIYGKSPEYDKGIDLSSKRNWLKNNLLAAFKTTDKYVWFYNERINWWKGEVDSGVTEIISGVKSRMVADRKTAKPVMKGLSEFFVNKGVGRRAFSYKFTRRTNILQLTFSENNIRSIQVFENSREIYLGNAPASGLKINLIGKYTGKGNLIIMVKNSNGEISVAWVN